MRSIGSSSIMVLPIMVIIATIVCASSMVYSYPTAGASSSGGEGLCPHLSSLAAAASLSTIPGTVSYDPTSAASYQSAVVALDWAAVKADIKAVLTTSQDFWPADNAHYGPFMIRQAWHCAGSYRISDGHGGCDGGRQRFEPERSWDDNTNLDKTKRLLWPIKQKYGSALSWGDLIILTGTTSIEVMGGPSLGFCAGRIDDSDGSDSILLGPSAEQQVDYPCSVNGQCKSPLGATTIGLIYVNPEGPMGVPVPSQSAGEVRDTFGRMAMNDRETVALIGGGHAFGKTHGACPLGPGPSPAQDPLNPWPGKCGDGKGANTFTSGFEGPWTLTPTKWSNSYFTQLLNNDWEVHVGPGGHNQWKSNTTSTMMLTSDISLLRDPLNSYQKIVNEFAVNITAFNEAFASAWYKLTTRDMGPVTRCLGNATAAAQSWQYPLPSPPSSIADFEAVRTAVQTAITTAKNDILPADSYGGSTSYGSIFIQLAYQSASTFRRTDYLGGANGARIRFEPQSKWETNVAMDKAIQLLQPVKDKFGATLSWADLIIAAGQISIEAAGGRKTSFCGGRTDATDGTGAEQLSPNINGSATAHIMTNRQVLSGLTSRQFVALQARPRSALQQERLGFSGTWSVDTRGGMINNQYFISLLTEQWIAYQLPNGITQYKAASNNATNGIYMTPADLNLKINTEWLAIAQEFAADNNLFVTEFAAAWTRLVTIDRFNGPLGNVCGTSTDNGSSSSGLSSAVVAIISVVATLVFAIVVYCVCLKQKSTDDRTEPLVNNA